MDFPLRLSDANFVSGMEEFRQDVTLLLKNPIRMFFQSLELGNQAPIHSADEALLEEGVKSTMNQLPGVIVENIKVSGSLVDLVLRYRDDIVKFQFSVDTEYEK